MKYIIGLDIGIGSVGWAVVRNDDDCKRLEDFGARIFESGEIIESNKNIRKSQRRRKYRGMRRRIRRRNHRKERLKNYLENIKFVNRAELSEFFAKNNHDIIDIRVRALDEKVTPVELTAALLHIAKRRGYKAFYELSDENNNAKDKKAKEEEEKDIYKALTNTADVIKNGGYRSIAEAIMKDSEHFSDKISGRYKYRNIKEKDEKGKKKSDGKISENDILFPTEMFEDEVRKILSKQKEFYSQLTDESIDKIFDIIFSRRDFEDGPGNTDDENRPYKGFVDSIGNCPYYKNEKRGHRYTVIGDLFALANKLSQYKYVEKNTGEVVKLPRDLMRNIVNQSLQSGSITKTKINELAKELNIVILNTKTAKNENIADCIKYLKAVKPIFESYGFDWDKLISEEYTDQNSLLNRVGDTISFNITPKRRIDALNKIDELKGKDELIKKLSKQNFSGTAKVSDKYMIDAINAFFDGTLVGEFQANVQQDEFSVSIKTEKLLKLKPFDNNSEYAQNPVVFRAINETRKVVNAIVQKYGAPNAMNIEIASELNKSFDTRQKISTQQNKNEKERKNAIKQISLITGLDEREIRSQYIERYLLGELQGWRCMYSNEEITNKKEAILNKGKQYEIDHIVPFSRILDDTLNNKALVLARENQKKGARTPLMYLSAEKEKEFKQRVNKLFKGNKITEKKYRCFMLESLVGEDAEKILGDWKTRNLNDTRYIAKFLVKYFNDNLYFAREKGDDKRPVVYAVKGAITSSLRRQWLNKETWGRYDKGELKKITYFDHRDVDYLNAKVYIESVKKPCHIKVRSQIFDGDYTFSKIFNNEYDLKPGDAWFRTTGWGNTNYNCYSDGVYKWVVEINGTQTYGQEFRMYNGKVDKTGPILTGVKLFASKATGALKADQENYKTNFDGRTLEHIYFKTFIEAPGSHMYVQVFVKVIYMEDDSVLYNNYRLQDLDKDTIACWNSIGYSSPGCWKKGLYKYTVRIGNSRSYEGNFTVY